MRHMTLHKVLITLAISTFSTPTIASETVDQTINAIISRAQSVFSARLDFTLTAEIGGKETVDQYRLSLAGQDWALRYPGSGGVMMNTRDATFRFYETQTDAGQFHLRCT